jgi:DNA uptake protein ComE-like DNA-binding protein
MPTPGEKKALLFLSLVAVLGAGVRLVSANQVPLPSDAEARALDGQIRAVDSVRSGQRAAGRGQRKTPAARSGRRAARTQRESTSTMSSPDPLPAAHRPLPVDLDRAAAAEMESLPGIGPALARRIVTSRDSLGPFGSLEELQSRVRGVGPALAKRLAPGVTFSGSRSPPSAERTEPFGNGGTPARGKRRRGH